MKEIDLRFGDIITNGINYWMVTMDMIQTCFHCGQNGKRTIQLTPVLGYGTKGGGPIFTHLSFNRCDLRPCDIKPYWTRIRQLDGCKWEGL